MTHKLTRRQLLRLTALGGIGGLLAACAPNAAPTLAPPQATSAPIPPTAVPPTATAASRPATIATTAPNPTATPTTAAAAIETFSADIARAATRFLDALDAKQRVKATYAFTDSERTRWHWTTPSGFPRNGLPLNEMSQSQRDVALNLLQVSISAAGFQKALDIISLQKDLNNDPQLYYVTVFGAAGGAAPWGWRFEGHHLSRHFTIVNGQLAITPFFLGAWPTVNNAGLKAMEREEWAARELIKSLEGGKRQTALFQARTLTGHVTQNEAYVTPLDPVGLLASEFNTNQQALLLEIIKTYLGTLPDKLNAAHFERIRTAGLEKVRFGWAGSLEPRNPYYYRLQGPSFLLEHDNSRNGGTHIHSVWRDFKEDFGQNLL